MPAPLRPSGARADAHAESRDTAGGQPLTTSNGRHFTLRPIRGDDVAALLRAFARLTPEQIRLRVFHPMSALSIEAAERLCHLDAATAAAFVVVDAGGEIRGDARLYVQADNVSTEFALIVDAALTGIGIGRALLQRLLEESRHRGLCELWGLVLGENTTMLELARRLGARH